MNREKLKIAAGGVLASVGLMAGALVGDKLLSDSTNEAVLACHSTFDGSEQEACVKQVQGNAESYQMLSLVELVAALGIAGFGYRGWQAIGEPAPTPTPTPAGPPKP